MTREERLELHLRRLISGIEYLWPRAHRQLAQAKKLSEIHCHAKAAQTFVDERTPS